MEVKIVGKTLCLSGDVVISESEELLEIIRDHLRTVQMTMLLDLGHVEILDTAALQILVSTKRSLEERGKELHLTAVSQAAQEALVMTGLDAVFTVKENQAVDVSTA